IKKVNQVSTTLFQTSSYLIHQKNGIEVGQSVPHIHFHYIGRKQGDASSIKFAIQMITANMHGPVSDDYMQQTVESLKKELSNENTNL
ncbi:MAG: HIT domain-containing protein, partial [Simkaniaceae bacterium]|nr:HIT domain-containing protein [Simkaniaceae bacterium]